MLLKKLKSILVMLLVFGFMIGTTITSCGNKKTEEETEQSDEHPSEEEHPGDSDEHPSGEEHPSGGEHPSSDD